MSKELFDILKDNSESTQECYLAVLKYITQEYLKPKEVKKPVKKTAKKK